MLFPPPLYFQDSMPQLNLNSSTSLSVSFSMSFVMTSGFKTFLAGGTGGRFYIHLWSRTKLSYTCPQGKFFPQ